MSLAVPNHPPSLQQGNVLHGWRQGCRRGFQTIVCSANARQNSLQILPCRAGPRVGKAGRTLSQNGVRPDWQVPPSTLELTPLLPQQASLFYQTMSLAVPNHPPSLQQGNVLHGWRQGCRRGFQTIVCSANARQNSLQILPF